MQWEAGMLRVMAERQYYEEFKRLANTDVVSEEVKA